MLSSTEVLVAGGAGLGKQINLNKTSGKVFNDNK